MSTTQAGSYTRPTGARWTLVPDDPDTEPSRELVGGKAWSLWRMRSLGLRVPPAFVVTTEACAAYFDGSQTLPDGLVEELEAGVRRLETDLGRTFGATADDVAAGRGPLLVSVRSGAAISMPGMMDTILDLGMSPAVEAALAQESGDAAFAAEIHRRFAVFYGGQVLGCIEDLEDLPDTDAVRRALADDVGEEIPDDPWAQLHAAVGAVFASSRSRRAVAYRKHYGIDDDLGTAVTVQAMVFGNLDDSSGTGVLFTRSPVDGSRDPYGEYLPRAQGEDVVSGRVDPRPLSYLSEHHPDVHTELLTAAERLDADGRDAQDIEFTVQHGELFLLQSRAAKRTARAAVRIARALVDDGTLTPEEAVRRISAEQAASLLRPEIDADAAAAAEVLARGTAASPGVGIGTVVATSEQAQESPGSVLARHSTSPEDVHGMIAAVAVITEVGGTTSHAAVVGRALDTPCVVGVGTGVVESLLGRTVTVDAGSGTIYDGEVATTAVDEDSDDDLAEVTSWAERSSPVRVVAPGDPVEEPSFDGASGLAAAGDNPAEELPEVPAGTRTVSGAVFTTPDGVRHAMAAGVGTIVAARRLPVLLAAIAATAESGKGGSTS